MENTKIPILRSTERTDFLRCQQRWQWAWRYGLTLPSMSEALWFGIGIHKALAYYYGLGKKRNLDFVDVWIEYCGTDSDSLKLKEEIFQDRWGELILLGESMLQEYHKYWKGDLDWDIIATEEIFKLPIPRDWTFPGDADTPEDKIIAWFMSAWDAVYRDADGIYWLLETKTRKQIKLGFLPLNNQGGVYYAAANLILKERGVLSKHENIGGINYNFMRKAEPDTRPKDAEGYALNKNGSRSKVQPSPLFVREFVEKTPNESYRQIKRIAHEVDQMNLLREKFIEPTKNPTADCEWDCAFFQMCQLHEQGADWKDFMREIYTKKNPYEQYRKSA